ncbi:unnamed protein product, partial [marine sediment metagenome]
KMKASVLDLENLIQGFKLSCQTEGLSPKTTEWYISFVSRFVRFLQSRDFPTNLESIRKAHIRDFIRYLQVEARTPYSDKPLSPATVQGYVRSLKAFFAWTEKEEYSDGSIMRKIPVPKAPVKIVNTFTNEQFIKLVELCQRDNGYGNRNLAILFLMLDSGLRVSECRDIQLNDVDLENGSIRIRRGKGGKERIIPIGSLVQKTLWRYMNHARPQPLTTQVTSLFLSDRGLSLTKSGIQQIVRRYGKRAGISGVRCSPHTFRHTFAKNYLLNGGDIFSLQK